MASIVPLTALESASNGGFTHKVVLLAADVAALTSATAYSLYPAYAVSTTKTLLVVTNVMMYVKTAFNAYQSDGSTAVTLAVTVGDGTTANLFITSTSIKSTGITTNAATTPKVLAGDIIKFTPTFGASGDPTKTSAGEVHFYFAITDVAKLDQ